MTATATRPATEGHDDAHHADEAGTQGASILATSDHKQIGLLFLGTGFGLLLASLVLGIAVGVERIDPSSVSLLEYETDVLQLYTLERFGLLFAGVLPIFVGLALYLTPLQVGAPTVAFPRAAAMGAWLWLLGTGLHVAAFAINGGPWGGDPDGVDMWAASTILLVSGLLLATVSVMTTVIAHRAPGMSLTRVPAFSWASMITGSMLLVTLPVLMGDLLLILVDHSSGRLAFGLNTEVWAQVHWVLLAPTILVLAVPALGVAADAIPVHAGARQRWHNGVLFALAALGVLSFGAWARPHLADDPLSGASVTGEPLYQGMAALGFLPLLLLLGAWADTFRRGRLRVTGPALAGVLSALLLGAVLTAGVAIAVPRSELAGTTATNGVTTAAALVGVLGLFAALGHWGPKLFGKVVPEGAITLGALLAFVAGLVILGGEVVAGAYDQSSIGFTGVLRDEAEAMGIVITAGYAAAALSVLVVGLALLTAALSSGESAGDDPWGGHTLEWATSSPPAEGNFAEAPMVTSATPLLDERGDDAEQGGS
jgi:heme/copper-type cytochrome/quinol oxidase subunit 1